MRSEAEIRERLEWLNDYLDGVRDRLKAGLSWLDSPYLSESGHQAYDEYTDDLYNMIKALKGGIYELELVLGNEEEVSEESEEEAWNILSLREIPDEFIDEVMREGWIERAKQSERVHAYRSPDGHVWNVWDGYQRIELRSSRSHTLDSRIEAILQLYRNGGFTLQEFEARILDAIQATHTTPTQPPSSPRAPSGC